VGGDHRKLTDAINVWIIWIHLVKILSGYSAIYNGYFVTCNLNTITEGSFQQLG